MMRFGILGPLEVVAGDGRAMELLSHKLRALLALLIIDANRVVSLDAIIDQLWGDSPPATATGTLQAYISQLRRILEPDRGPREPPSVVVTKPPGYVLCAGPDQIDARRFERLVEEGEEHVASSAPQAADEALAGALALWRGEPFADLSGERFVLPEAVRLSELRLLAWERRIEAWLALGRHAAAATQIETLVGDHPLRERLWLLWMIALYRAGRPADGLRAYQRCRPTLDEELGIEPGPDLRRLEQAILCHEPLEELRVPERAIPPPSAAPVADVAGEPGDAAGEVVPTSPLVGREFELRRLSARAADACRGHGWVVLIEGEAGIGKTRLVEELRRVAEHRGMTIVWAHTAETAGAPPYWPWVRSCGSSTGRSPAARRWRNCSATSFPSVMPRMTRRRRASG